MVQATREHVTNDARPTPTPRERRFIFSELLLFATLSLVASFVLSHDALKLAADPDVDLACSISVFIDCAKVGTTWQAEIFGFPNAFLGLITEPVLMTIAVAGLAGSRFPRWLMFATNCGALGGVVFAYWMLYQSTFVIGALCPWCLVVTVSTTFVFVAITHWNLLENNLYLSWATHAKAMAFARGGGVAIALILWIALVVIIEAVRWVPAML